MNAGTGLVEIITAPHNFDDSFEVYSLLFKAQQFLGTLDINCSEAVVQKFCSVGTGASARQKFVQEARFVAPRFLRVIDCKVSVQDQKVVIVDCPLPLFAEEEPPFGYTAISHTYGQDVYEVFNCGCAADCRARVPRADPAKSHCNGIRHLSEDDSPGLQQKTIGDLLLMCKLLVELAGVRYAWHDGVCIAQHDEEEVRYFIQHIAWIYANADDTVIFLHYIGRPMAPIAPPSYEDGTISRWQTRVWTFQEAALSKCRRYCVRMGTASIKDSDEEFESRLASWYEPAGLDSTCILEEHQFFELCMDIFNNFDAVDGNLTKEWSDCIGTWIYLLLSQRFSFPTIVHALESCSSRKSKHEGDRINSILGIAQVHGFVAPKDEEVEESTMEFFDRLGQRGLAIALFTMNRSAEAAEGRPHTWYPTLSSPLMFTPAHFCTMGPNFHTDSLEFEVKRSDGSLEVRGLLACVSLQLTLVPFQVDASTHSSRDCSIMQREACWNLSAFEKWDTMGNLVYCCTENDHQIPLGISMRPYFSSIEMFRVDGEPDLIVFPQFLGERTLSDHYYSTCACHLVFPAEVFEIEIQDHEDGNHEDTSLYGQRKKWLSNTGSTSFPAVMVQGDVHLQVKKIGCFVAQSKLLQLLFQDHYLQEYLTFLDKLVVL